LGTTLIKNAEVITMNMKNDIIKGDILIKDDVIEAIGPQLYPSFPVDKIIDASNRTIIPGFIQTHIHLCQTLFRGRADDMELMDWLKKRIWPLEAAHDEESIYYSALLGIGELIESGTTTIVDMETVHHTNTAFRALSESGIRALSGKVMMDKGKDVPIPLQEETSQSIQESVNLLEAWHMHDNGRIQYAFSPRFVVSCSEELLKEVKKLSDYYNVKIHTHASENKGEIAIVQDETGMRNIEYLDHLGIANERLILAHCIWLNRNEKEIIKKRGVHVSHCPGSNLKLSSGIAEIPDLLQLGVNLSLGADGAPCNNNLNMFQEMKLAALIQKPCHGPTCMDAHTVFHMATIGGAKAVGMEKEIGSLEIGKKADLAILNLNTFHTLPSFDMDPISRIVYSASRDNVETTIINGKIVMENRIHHTLKKEIIFQEANRSIQRISKRLANLVV
jgi:5-methylthioadenosine/S-adenosylhomocysteine deaminase